jgi:hypothetical protein
MIIYFNIILLRIVQAFNKYNLQYRENNIFLYYKELFFLSKRQSKRNETLFLKLDSFLHFNIIFFTSTKYINIIHFRPRKEKDVQIIKSNNIYNMIINNLWINYYSSG